MIPLNFLVKMTMTNPMKKTRMGWAKNETKMAPVFFILFALFFAFGQQAFSDPGTQPAFGGIPKRISIQRGTAVSTWLDRGDIAKAAEMSPVGDGTWEYFTSLTPGATYNFIFFAVPTGTVQGLTTGNTYYDTPPTDYNGTINFPTSTSSTTIVGNSTAWFGKAGSGDDRRLLYVPSGNSTYYVFCNFSHTPNPPSNIAANAGGPTRVTLSWNNPKDNWNSTDLADVVAGGNYMIYRSTSTSGGPFTLLVTTPGYATSYEDLGLTLGVTYFYVMVSSDAYRGASVTGKVNQSGIDDNFVMKFPDFSQDSARTAVGVPVIFKVDRPAQFKIDAIDYAKIGDNAEVYLTPWDEDGRRYPWKMKGRIVSCYLPKDE